MRISTIICTKKEGNFPVSLDSFLSVGYNRNVENCLLRVMMCIQHVHRQSSRKW